MRRILWLGLLLSTLAAGGVAAVALRAPAAGTFSLPAEASLLPPQASFVAGVDVQRLVASQAYQRFQREGAPAGFDVWGEIEKRTGVRPERDVASMLMASDSSGNSLTVVRGRFDRGKVEAALGANSTMAAREQGGRKLWTYVSRPGEKESAVAVVDDGLLVGGMLPAVQAALERRDASGSGLGADSPLRALLSRVPPGSTFWMCGDQGAMSAASKTAPQAAAWTMPEVRAFVVSGDLDPELRASLVALTPDEPSARKVADTVRTLMSLLTMQASQRPEVKELTSGIEVSQEGSEVRIGARIAHETLARLQAPARPVPRPTPAQARPSPRPVLKK